MSKALASEGVDIDFIIPYTAEHPGIDYMNIYSATPLPPNYHDLGAYNNGSEEDREKFVEVSKSCYDKFKELIKDDELFDATAEFCGKAE